MGLGIVDPSQPAPEYLKKGFRFQWCALVLYHTYPSLCVAYVVWLTGVRFWPGAVLLSMPVAADLLRIVNAIEGRFFVAFRQRQSGGWLMRNIKPLHLIYPAVGLGAIIPYYVYRDLCLPWFNAFLAQYYPAYSWVQLKLGPACTVPHVTVLMIAFIILQFIFAALMALASFLLFVDQEKFRAGHFVQTSNVLYIGNIKDLRRIERDILRMLVYFILFQVMMSATTYIQVIEWDYRKMLKFHSNLLMYVYYICSQSLVVVITSSSTYALLPLAKGFVQNERKDRK